MTDTAKNLLAPGKGILAADESTSTITKRFTALGIESTPESRRLYRQMLFTTPGLQEFISGVILYDETIRQKTSEGINIPKLLESKGIIPGIKVDKGVWKMPNFGDEKVTEGLDGLRDRLIEYKSMGAKFAKWRAVITIGEEMPSEACLEANADSLGRYVAFCQEQDIVPIVEPEVLMDGSHNLEKCREVTEKTLRVVFDKLRLYKVALEGIILKPNMIISGTDSLTQATATEVAKVTVETFLKVVPTDVPGVAFLSGGQTPDQATENLAAINKTSLLLRNKTGSPWQLSFSYGRALQNEALTTWVGKEENVAAAQKAFYERCKKVADACSVKPS